MALASAAWSQDAPPESDTTAQAEQPAGDTLDSGPNPEDTDSSSAYERPPEPPLPVLPDPPKLPGESYPDCREEYKKGANYLDRADLINACTIAIDTYYIKVLLPYRQAMIDYQNEISRLYTEEVAPNNLYNEGSKNSFYTAMIAQHEASNPGGANMAQARAAEQRYHADRSYLEDRFCYNTGCGAYPDPVTAFPQEAEAISQALLAEQIAAGEVPATKSGKKSSKKSAASSKPGSSQADARQGCKRARKRGSALGSFLGGALGSFGGLGRTGTALLTGFSGLMVGEIACKLDAKEQEVASKATVEVLSEEKVGATAEWISPTRQGVSGSSTITDLKSEPDGRRCLTITDIAIIEGEETRVEKQMCRAKEGAAYVLVA